MGKTKRKKTPVDIEKNVLVRSKRRCCLCFHLNGCLCEKKGQIAHLDKDPLNAEEGNLAFLCMPHHDEYDSVPSQSIGLKQKEVRHARQKLYDYFEDETEIWVKIKLDRDFASYTDAEQSELMCKIRDALCIGGDIEVRKNKGCVELALKLTQQQAKQLDSVWQANKLTHFGVTDVWLETSDLKPRLKDALIAAGLAALVLRGVQRRKPSSSLGIRLWCYGQAAQVLKRISEANDPVLFDIWWELARLSRGDKEPTVAPGQAGIHTITLRGGRVAKLGVKRPDKYTLEVHLIKLFRRST